MEMGWVGLVYNMLWVGLGLYFGGLGWVGFQKVDPCPCLVQAARQITYTSIILSPALALIVLLMAYTVSNRKPL